MLISRLNSRHLGSGNDGVWAGMGYITFAGLLIPTSLELFRESGLKSTKGESIDAALKYDWILLGAEGKATKESVVGYSFVSKDP